MKPNYEKAIPPKYETRKGKKKEKPGDKKNADAKEKRIRK